MWAGHQWVHRIQALIEHSYYWLNMRDDIEGYVRTCLVRQQDKVEHQRPVGLLEPLPTLERPWESISMDFIIGLPLVEGYSSIMVVVDRFSKYGVFILAPTTCHVEDVAWLFFIYVVKY